MIVGTTISATIVGTFKFSRLNLYFNAISRIVSLLLRVFPTYALILLFVRHTIYADVNTLFFLIFPRS